MKTIVRILVILGAAVAIASLTLGLVNVSGAQAAQSVGVGQFHGSGGLLQGGVRLEHGSSSGGTLSMAEIVKNLAIVAVIVMVVAGAERLLRILRKRRPVPVPVSIERPDRKE